VHGGCYLPRPLPLASVGSLSEPRPALSLGSRSVTPLLRPLLSVGSRSTRVVPRPDGTAELRWAGGNLTLTAEEFGWIARLDEGASARNLGGTEALAFCQKLASAGLVTVQPVAAMKAAE
jgi:hypothetical protein